MSKNTAALAILHDRLRGTDAASAAHVCPECLDGNCGKARVCALCDGTRRVVSLRKYDRLRRTASLAVALAEGMRDGGGA